MPQRTTTTTTSTVPPSKSGTTRKITTEELNRLAATARAEHEEVIRLEGKALDHAIRAGEALHQAKLLVHQGKGSWSAWTAEHLRFSKQHADTYIRVFLKQDKLTEMRPENRSIRRADEVIAGRADKYGVLIPKPPKEETGAVEKPSAGGADVGTVGRVKYIKADPNRLLSLAKREGLKAKITEVGLIDLINVILEEVGAGVLLTTAEDEEVTGE